MFQQLESKRNDAQITITIAADRALPRLPRAASEFSKVSPNSINAARSFVVVEAKLAPSARW